MTYTPSKDTIQNLRDLYELRGSYAGVARDLNKGRRSDSQQFSPNQVKRMLNQRNQGGSGSGYSKVNDPKPVRLSSAQQRSLQRKAKIESGTYEKAFKESKAPNAIYDSIKNNISNKRNRLKERRKKLLKQGQKKEADALNKEIQALNKFDEELDKTAKNAKGYKDWKGMQDAKTP